MAAFDKRKGSNVRQLHASLCGAIKANEIKPLYLLYGEEGFLIADLLRRLKAALLDPSAGELDLAVYNGETAGTRLDWVKIAAELRTPPFLSRRRLVIVKNSGLFKIGKALSAEQEDAANECLGKGSAAACLVLIEDKIDKRVKNRLKLVQENGCVAEFTRMDSAQLLNWLAAYLQRYGQKIARTAAESLIDRCESDMQLLSLELNKLRLYAQSQGISALNLNEVNLVCRPDLRGSIFNLTDALAAGDAAEALRLYRLLRANREAAQYILFMLARHLRQLICACSAGHEGELGQVLRVQPFVLGRLIRQSRAFHPDDLIRMYEACQNCDSKIKWGKCDEDLGLESLILAFSRRGSALAEPVDLTL